MASSRKNGLLERMLIALGVAFSWAIGVTLRVRIEGEEILTDRVAQGRPVLLASWHNRLLTCMHTISRYRPLVMISQSRDGERIARISARFGFRPVRGSSSRGGARALLEMVRKLRKGEICAHLVDGPRGPLGEIKPGILLLAQRGGADIIPMYFQAERRWRTRGWDRMEIPKPFSRVLARVGTPVEVPRELGPEAAEELRKSLEVEMAQEYARLEADLARGVLDSDPAESALESPDRSV